MRVLVTGARGFVGTALRAELADRWPGCEVLGLTEPPEDDICVDETMERVAAFMPNMVFHLAALHFVPWCREHPSETLWTNVIGTDRVLRATEEASTVVAASSAAVYGFADEPLAETCDLRPVDVYGESKVMNEVSLRQRAQRIGGRVIAARLFNVVGLNDPVPHLFPLILRSRNATARLDLEGLRWARDYVHVEDVARSLVDLAAVGPSGFTAVNVCTSQPTTGWDLVARYNVNAKDDASKRRTGGGNLVGRNDRLRELTGRVPANPWEDERL